MVRAGSPTGVIQNDGACQAAQMMPSTKLRDSGERFKRSNIYPRPTQFFTEWAEMDETEQYCSSACETCQPCSSV
jgi:hypothetical protein